MGKWVITEDDLSRLMVDLANKIVDQFPDKLKLNIYPVARGGIPVAYRLMFCLRFYSLRIVSDIAEADLIVDDLIDSGATRDRILKKAGRDIPFLALIDKPATGLKDWVTFPWEEKEAGADEGIEENVRRILQYIEPSSCVREGLLETPHRVAKAYEHWFKGYSIDPVGLLKTFADGATGVDEMITVRDIPFYSHCEHHLAPFFGTATVAYLPNRRIVGLSKLARLVDAYARRLQVQERLTNQIADTLFDAVDARGVGVFLQARHMCMESRGIERVGSTTLTTALRGIFKEDAVVRHEFLRLVK